MLLVLFVDRMEKARAQGDYDVVDNIQADIDKLDNAISVHKVPYSTVLLFVCGIPLNSRHLGKNPQSDD